MKTTGYSPTRKTGKMHVFPDFPEIHPATPDRDRKRENREKPFRVSRFPGRSGAAGFPGVFSA